LLKETTNHGLIAITPLFDINKNTCTLKGACQDNTTYAKRQYLWKCTSTNIKSGRKYKTVD